MKYIIHIRHSIRENSSDDLSPEGVDLAKRAKEEYGIDPNNISLAISSEKPRAIQTVESMGIEVTETRSELKEFGWGFATRDAIKDKEMRKNFRNFHYSLLERMGDDQTTLLVSHAGVVLSGLLSLLPFAQIGHLDPWFDHCQGYKIEYDVFDENWRLVELLQIKKQNSL